MSDKPGPVRLTLGGGEPSIDLSSLAEVALNVQHAAEQVRIAAMRVHRTHLEREEVAAKHRRAVELLQKARRDLDNATGELQSVENGHALKPSQPKETPCHRP
jgi:predicted nucleic acid-binding protein